jgi:nitrogen fixation NifU-like protein
MMTAVVQGKTDREAGDLAGHFIHLLTDEMTESRHREAVGKLKFFEGVKNFPIRVKCATLAWRALEEALKDQNQRKTEVSTEEEAL